MFRGKSKTKMDPTVFGAGSIITADRGERYLLVASRGVPGTIVLLNLQTMEIEPSSVPVEDVNFLSESEARQVCDILGKTLMWTFTDFDLDTQGLKFIRHEAQKLGPRL